jgi:hypothetical protein
LTGKRRKNKVEEINKRIGGHRNKEAGLVGKT